MRTILPLLAVLSLLACDRTPDAAGTASAASPAPGPIPPGPVPMPAIDPVPPVPAAGIDPCLLGTWRLTPEHAIEFYRAAMATGGSPAEIIGVEGTSVVTLNAAGETTFDMSNVRVRMRAATGPVPMEMTMTFLGSGRADFSASNGTITYTNSTSTFSGSVTISIQGRQQTAPWNSAMGDSMGATIRGSHSYRCSPTELVIISPGSPAPVTWVR